MPVIIWVASLGLLLYNFLQVFALHKHATVRLALALLFRLILEDLHLVLKTWEDKTDHRSACLYGAIGRESVIKGPNFTLGARKGWSPGFSEGNRC